MPPETPRRYYPTNAKRAAQDKKPRVKFDQRAMRIQCLPATSTAKVPHRGILKHSSANQAANTKEDLEGLSDDEETYVEVEWIQTGKTEVLNLNELDPAIRAVGPASSIADKAGVEISEESREEMQNGDRGKQQPKVEQPLQDLDITSDNVEQIKLLLEHYLSDKAALRDELLMKLARKASGWIPLSFLATYGKLRILIGSQTGTELLRAAIDGSELLELSYDRGKVRRKIPFPDDDDTFASCTVVQIQEDFPVSRNQILEIFKLFGQVRGIYVLPRGLCVKCGLQKASDMVCLNVQKFLSRDENLQRMHWAALVFVEFSTHREAETAMLIMNRMSNKYGGRSLPVLPMIVPRVDPPQELRGEHQTPSRSFPDNYAHKLREHCCHSSGDGCCAVQRFRRPAPCCGSLIAQPPRGDVTYRTAVKTEASKAQDETFASDPAIIDCGLPLTPNDGVPKSQSVAELRLLQIARQRASWEPCLACEQARKKAYVPIAHEFVLRLHQRKNVTLLESDKDEADQFPTPQQSTPMIGKTLETSDSSTPSSGYGTDACSSLEDSSDSGPSNSRPATPLRALKIPESIQE